MINEKLFHKAEKVLQIKNQLRNPFKKCFINI